jgi:hypothetical protein
MNVMSNSTTTEADVLRCGYDVGYFNKSDIERWADRLIAATEAPCYELLDLSILRNAHPLDVMKLLRSLGAADPAATLETQVGFIALLYTTQQITTQLAIRGLFALVHEPGTTADQESHIYYLDDGYDLAVAGTYGTMDDIERELNDFLSPYAERITEQYPQLIPSMKQTVAEQSDELKPE